MKNKIGFHMNYFRGTPYEMDIISALEHVYHCGGQALELMPTHLEALSEPDLKQFAALVEKWDIDLICGAGRSSLTDASSAEPAIREASYQATLHILPMLQRVGCHKWDGLIHASWPGRPQGVLTVEEKRRIIERTQQEMQRILPLAETYDIDFCFEVVNRFEHYLINSSREGIDYCSSLNHPRAKLLLDVFHMNIEENDICKAVAEALDEGYLAHFHISEANRSVPGTVESHIDWPAIFRVLIEHGYSGSIVLEPFVTTGIPFTTNSCVWRDLSDKADFKQLLSYVEIGIDFARRGLRDATAASNSGHSSQ